jgi:hypothetical protein
MEETGKLELTVGVSNDNIGGLIRMLEALDDEQTSVTSGSAAPIDDPLANAEFPDELREVVEALNEHRGGAALRIIHKTVSDDPESSFTEGGSEWNDEREQVKHLLGVAETLGVARRDKKTWYPVGATNTA